MLEILTLGLIYGVIAAGLSFAWIEATNYRSIFGFIRYWIAVRFESEDDATERLDILSQNIPASQQAERMNQDYYGFVAKHSTLVFLLTCKYCFGTWILLIMIYSAFPFFDSQMILSSIASLYLTLYITQPKTIIIKP